MPSFRTRQLDISIGFRFFHHLYTPFIYQNLNESNDNENEAPRPPKRYHYSKVTKKNVIHDKAEYDKDQVNGYIKLCFCKQIMRTPMLCHTVHQMWREQKNSQFIHLGLSFEMCLEFAN